MGFRIYSHQKTGKSIRGVLFDMDGVILDTEKLYLRFWREAAGFFGYEMTEQQALGMRSLNKEAGQAKLESYFGPGVSRAALRDKRVELMDAYTEQNGVEVKPGVFQLLEYLRERKIPAAITTSSPMSRVRRYLEPLGLWDQFDRLCSGHDVPCGKPAPDIYLYGAQAIEVPPDMCIAIEDSYAGIVSASCAGCFPIMVPDLDEPDEKTENLLYAKCDSLLDIISLLEQW